MTVPAYVDPDSVENASPFTTAAAAGSDAKTAAIQHLAGDRTWTAVNAAGGAAPAYAANWANTGGAHQVMHFRIGTDEVWVCGKATAGAGAGTTIFTLPAGYRPLSQNEYPCSFIGLGASYVTVGTSGAILLAGAPSTGLIVALNLRIPLF